MSKFCLIVYLDHNLLSKNLSMGINFGCRVHAKLDAKLVWR